MDQRNNFVTVPPELSGRLINCLTARGLTIEELSPAIRVPELVLARLADGDAVMRAGDRDKVEAWVCAGGRRC